MIYTHNYINNLFVLLLRYAKEKSNKRIKCTVCSESNRGREGTKKRIESRTGKTDIERTICRIRTRKGDILQSQRCQENLKESGSVRMNPLHSFFTKFTITFMILDNIIVAPYMLKLIPYIWRSDVVK